MMHYRKGENVEKEITKDDLPFQDCMPQAQKDFLWMHVKGGTKVNNVITFAKNALDKGEYRTVVWSGSGGGVVKTVSCAEILKRSYALYQVSRMCYTTVTEHWLPQMDGLEEIVANRQIPCLHILMSLDAIDDSIHGLQKPNSTTDFWVYSNKPTSSGAASSRSQRPEEKARRRKRPGMGGKQKSHNESSQLAQVSKEPQQQQQNQQQRRRQSNQAKGEPNVSTASATATTSPQQQQRHKGSKSAEKSHKISESAGSKPMES